MNDFNFEAWEEWRKENGLYLVRDGKRPLSLWQRAQRKVRQKELLLKRKKRRLLLQERQQSKKHGKQWDEWRKAVFERDNFTCQKYKVKGELCSTGKKFGDLHAHHILNFAKYTDLRFNVSNGVTLSKQAHIEFHRKYGTRGNTREQLVEFLSTPLS